MAENWLPTLSQFWNGCVLSSLAHAVAVARLPDLASDQSWDADTYCVQDGQGSRGAVAFRLDPIGQPLQCVGGVFSLRSDRRRAPSALDGNFNHHFDHTSFDSSRLLESVLSHLVEDDGGKPQTGLTTGFWSAGTILESADPWSEFTCHGGHLLERQMQPVDAGIQMWAKNYSMSNAEVDVVRDLYEQKLLNPTGWITLSPGQYSVLSSAGGGLDECWESFAELRIKFPV